MSAKGNYLLPDLIPADRTQSVAARALPVVRLSVLRAGRLAVPAAPGGWLAVGSAKVRAAEFWELLSYLAIWLCGWITVALCFR
jgi:hypothetical protein